MNDLNSQQELPPIFATVDRVFGGVGILFLTLGLGWGGWNLAWNNGTSTVTGKVVRMVRSDPSQGRGAKPVAEYQAGDQALEVCGVMPTNPPVHAVGDSVTVRYKVASPQDAVIDTFVNRWLFPLALSAFGIVFTLIGARAIYRSASGEQRAPKVDLEATTERHEEVLFPG